jgi:hypothetical protein
VTRVVTGDRFRAGTRTRAAGRAPEAHAREPQAPTVPAPTPVAEAPVAETSVAEAPVVEAQTARLAPEAPLTERSLWPAELATLAKSASEWLTQPRIRLSLTGMLLLLIGGLLMTSSVWTFPLVIVGALMVAIAWIGHRLEGRFGVEWGPTGTQLAFRATIKAAHLGHDAAMPAAVQTIDGEAHTVELDLAELKALIAAVESTQAGLAPTDAPAQDIRIRRVVPGRPE